MQNLFGISHAGRCADCFHRNGSACVGIARTACKAVSIEQGGEKAGGKVVTRTGGIDAVCGAGWDVLLSGFVSDQAALDRKSTRLNSSHTS